MLPYLAAAIIVIALPTLYIAMQYREYRKFLAGAFFVSSGMQFYSTLRMSRSRSCGRTPPSRRSSASCAG
jgi:hypothetical protein